MSLPSPPKVSEARTVAGAVTTPPVTGNHVARERIQRVLYISIGIAAVVFAGLRVGQILDQSEAVMPAYAIVAFAVGAVMPALLIVLPFLMPIRAVTGYAKVIPIAFFVVHASWLAFMTVDRMDAGPWLQAVNAIPVLIAAAAYRHWGVWLYAFAQLPLVAVTQRVATEGPWLEGILSGVVSVLFSGLLAGAALALVSAGDTQDALAQHTRALAARDAASRTRSREQARINSIVFDEVMTALELAATSPLTDEVTGAARAALERIRTIGSGSHQTVDYSPDDLLAALRAAASDVEGTVEFWHREWGTGRIAAEVVEALSEATAEAVRNSLQHAAPDGRLVTRVVNVTIADDVVQVEVEDSGVGFDVRAVNERKMGLRVSVMERMQALAGGSAHVDSRPGRGAVVTLRWVRFA